MFGCVMPKDRDVAYDIRLPLLSTPSIPGWTNGCFAKKKKSDSPQGPWVVHYVWAGLAVSVVLATFDYLF